MKKTLSFEKDLTFQTMIGEITTISFEEDLKFVDKNDITGNFYVSGKYKMTEASAILEDFSYSIPIEIATIENYDLETTKINVESFTYEIIDDDILRCKIDILIEGREEIILDEIEKEEIIEEIKEPVETNLKKIEVLEEIRECDDDIVEKVLEDLPIKEENITKIEEKSEVIIEEKNTIKEERPKIKVNSLFSSIGEENDTFATYSIYIMRETDTIEKVMDKYKIKKEDLEIYNDLATIELNSKVIIPMTNNNE